MRHPNLSHATFLNQAHALNASEIVREALADLFQQPAIHLVDDLEVTRQQGFEPDHRPAFQGFRQQSVIRVGKGTLRDIPGKLPRQASFVQQDAHQFRNRKSRVGIVQLNRSLLRQSMPVEHRAPEATHQVRQRAGDQKVLLHESKLPAYNRGVVRIKNARERLGGERLSERGYQVTAAERMEVEIVGRCSAPEAQRPDSVASKTYDKSV